MAKFSSFSNAGFPPTWKVKKNLERKWSWKVRELFMFLQKVRESQRTFF